LTLSGTDTFTGGTTVQGISLLVDSPGSLNSSSTVTVDSSSTPGRAPGSVGPILSPGGTGHPGDPSVATAFGVLTAPSADFTNGGTLVIGVASYVTPGTNYDQLSPGQQRLY